MSRAAALGITGWGAPLVFEDLRFARSNSAVAIAGSAESPAAARAVPPVAPAVLLAEGPELTGRVLTYRWPAGGPPGELLGPSGQRVEHGAETVRPSACQRCGNPLRTDGSRGGRPARYCSGACRTAAHRARHRTAPDIPMIPAGQLA